jgi:DNA (cytosine-5)-methyltransferase 1
MKKKIKVLNLYAGIGGNRKNWENVEVTAVENNLAISAVYQKLFPGDKVIIDDAHDYLIKHFREFDFIWSSPPCQTHSKMNKATRHDIARYPDMSLYQEIIFLQHFFKGKWVVENVCPYYVPLIPAQRIGRHLFWTNCGEMKIENVKSPPNFSKLSTLKARHVMMDWLGIHFNEVIYYKGNHCPVQVLRNCVHPFIGEQVFNHCVKGNPK